MEPTGEIAADDQDASQTDQPLDEFALPSDDNHNRRTRLAGRKGKRGPALPPKMHSWLIRTTRVHAHLCYIVRCFGKPPADTPGDTVEARASRRDRTLLFDCWAHSIGELTELQNELLAEMQPTDVTSDRPGTAGKIETLAARAARLETLFLDEDARL